MMSWGLLQEFGSLGDHKEETFHIHYLELIRIRHLQQQKIRYGSGLSG
jgi:hypothetical protein